MRLHRGGATQGDSSHEKRVDVNDVTNVRLVHVDGCLCTGPEQGRAEWRRGL